MRGCLCDQSEVLQNALTCRPHVPQLQPRLQSYDLVRERRGEVQSELSTRWGTGRGVASLRGCETVPARRESWRKGWG
jgi:hypothetical protein